MNLLPARESAVVNRVMPKSAARVRVRFEREVLERQVQICKAFANPTRLQILELLGERDWQAGELQQALGIAKANLSQHLTVLKAAGAVITRRDGKQVTIGLAMPEIKRACALIREVLRVQIEKSRKLTV